MDLAAVVSSPEIVRVGTVKGDENDTVEVVSTNDNVLGADTTETLQEMVSSVQFPIPSGMIEIDGQSLNLVDMSDPTSIASSNAMAAAIAIGTTGTLVVETGVKRPIMTESLISDTAIPRKKSRNYLDSHKTIEKKRRDRINTGLMTLREIIPDCKQYGSKKLDKAEILEMSIDYIHKLQSQNNGRQVSADLVTSQKEWASEIMTWIFQNKLLHSGPNALEQFCNSLLLHLQSYGNQTTAPNNVVSSNLLLMGQGAGSTSNEEDQLTLLQQLANTANNSQSPIKDPTTAQVQNAQIALLLLQQQQQQQLLQQQPDTSAEPSTTDNATAEGQNQMQQLQQLQHLQMLLLQHLANPANQKQSTVASNQDCHETGDQANAQAIVDQNIATSITEGTPGVELTLSSATSTSDNLSVHYSGNLLVAQDAVDPSTSQMWSQPAERSPLLIGTQETAIDDSVQEVELIGQDH